MVSWFICPKATSLFSPSQSILCIFKYGDESLKEKPCPRINLASLYGANNNTSPCSGVVKVFKNWFSEVFEKTVSE